jgi:hypothetical protein
MLTLPRSESGERGTFGVLVVNGSSGERFQCVTLELPWRMNAHDVSCIPAGVYPVHFRWSQHHDCFVYEVRDVPNNRKDVEFHVGNFLSNSRGCILVGSGVAHDHSMIVGSRLAFDRFMAVMDNVKESTITIHDAPGFNTLDYRNAS